MKNIQIIIIGLWLLISACGQKQETKTEKPVFADDAIVAIQLAKVEQITTSEPVVTSGAVASTDEARMSFKVGGIIQKIYVKEGQTVSKGQLLATLDMTEINAQVNQARLSSEKANRDYRRVKNMSRDTAATLEQMQNVTTALNIAKQGLNAATFNQSYAQIRASIGGTILKKLANEGELVGPGVPVFMLASNQRNDWVVRVGVSDRDWARLKLGDKATIQLDAYPDDTFEGKVSELAQAADPINKLYEIEVKINPNGKRFAAGLFAKIDLNPSQNRSYAVIPIEAVLEGNGKNAFVFVLDSSRKKVKKMPIVVGYIENNKVLITNGLDGINEVVTSGSAFLSDASNVVVK
jgi:membrane fusion protein, multidrug efflux system